MVKVLLLRPERTAARAPVVLAEPALLFLTLGMLAVVVAVVGQAPSAQAAQAAQVVAVPGPASMELRRRGQTEKVVEEVAGGGRPTPHASHLLCVAEMDEFVSATPAHRLAGSQ